MLMILFGHTCSDEACVTSSNTLALFAPNIKANFNNRDSCFTLFGYGVKYRGLKNKIISHRIPAAPSGTHWKTYNVMLKIFCRELGVFWPVTKKDVGAQNSVGIIYPSLLQ